MVDICNFSSFISAKQTKIKEINILEKNSKPGGLLRSFKFDKLYYDVGPHIIFSKHQDILEFNKKILNKNISKLTRSIK